ncbi:MAG: hypothetical protein AAGA16_11830 [Cyanobacteria bacterium P01_E01_bin.35]
MKTKPMLEKDLVQSRLANLIYELTIKGAAVWVRRQGEHDCFYCFTNNEKIEIEVLVAEGEEENCLNQFPITFFLHYRDAKFMYIGDICDGDKLVDFMKYAPIDDAEYKKLNDSWFKYWQLHLTDNLRQFRNSLK